MRRLALLLVGGAVWLFLAAIPVFADGGPHVAAINNGSTGNGGATGNSSGVLTADSCAGCHRIHTSKSPTGYLLTSTGTVTDFCRSCHGATGTGASTDVDTGIQYVLDNSGDRSTGTVIGALRGGGFFKAPIATAAGYRIDSSSGSVSQAKIPVGTSTNVTSAHLAIDGNGITGTNIVWGEGAFGSAQANLPGPTLSATSEMECTSCHNPHGNGQYRILRPIPTLGSSVTTGDVLYTGPVVAIPSAVNVTDAPYVVGKTRNYSVIQAYSGTQVPTGTNTYSWSSGDFLLYADQVLAARTAGEFVGTHGTVPGDYTPLSGDYLHKAIPYNTTGASGTYPVDAPNGLPNTTSSSTSGDGLTTTRFRRDDPAGFSVNIALWCSQCHTRYNAPSGSRGGTDSATGLPRPSSGDSIFMYRHTSVRANRTCTTCHVAHGSNAVMNTNPANGTVMSANTPYPDGKLHTVGDSRLLKLDNRGICEMCHDPTDGSDATSKNVSSVQQGPIPVLLP